MGGALRDISAEWGAQRIKGLSVAKAIKHSLASPFRTSNGTAQKHIETSLIERFLYPKFGPGQMWEEVARRIHERGGQIHLRHRLVGVERDGLNVTAVKVLDKSTQSVRRIPCNHFISTMPISDLVSLLEPTDSPIRLVADHLPYRDFMTAGLLVRRMQTESSRHPAASQSTRPGNGMLPDNWIYVQEPDVKLGRVQIFNNWSPAMVADPDTIWLGLEYFCGQGDDLWSMEDGRFVDFAATELEKLGLIDRAEVIDGTVVRVPKAYPAYFGTYFEFDKLRNYLDQFSNIYPVGRNGMHRYNNQDHSMLAADSAVNAIIRGGGKSDTWQINADDGYHEEIAALDDA